MATLNSDVPPFAFRLCFVLSTGAATTARGSQQSIIRRVGVDSTKRIGELHSMGVVTTALADHKLGSVSFTRFEFGRSSLDFLLY